MTAEGQVSPTRVNVDTLNGVVTLKGEVPTQQEKEAAERAARKVDGVKRIENQIVVNPATAGTGVPSGTEVKEATKEAVGNVAQEVAKETGEAVLVSKIKARLLAAGYGTVAVDINQGEATLKGEVASDKDRTAVEAIVHAEQAEVTQRFQDISYFSSSSLRRFCCLRASAVSRARSINDSGEPPPFYFITSFTFAPISAGLFTT
jgi:osmotically-inducible protein OsmY